ncbi:hypothetical protein [Chromobacterium violaceum]|uniref:hypothetical protein n=1 Tax=Chromobacterium violaceum TaxID=536 RepID=UPI00105532DA|nr:hypothetical protein [Chromobacterium violaceum]
MIDLSFVRQATEHRRLSMNNLKKRIQSEETSNNNLCSKSNFFTPRYSHAYQMKLPETSRSGMIGTVAQIPPPQLGKIVA